MDYPLIQSIDYNGVAVPPEWLHTATYIETLDLSGPKLILRFHDEYGILRDKGGFKERQGVLKIAIADPLDRDQTFLEETFTIEKIDSDGGGYLRLQCLAEAVAKLKIIADKCTIYPPAPPNNILTGFAGSAPVDASQFPAGEAFHLLDGQRPSRLLRKVAAENAARIFYLRGKWYFKSLDDLLKASPVATYYHNASLQKNVITEVRSHGESVIAQEVARYRLLGWDVELGLVQSGKGRPKMIGLGSEAQLAAMNRLLVNEIEFSCRANPDPALMPSSVLQFEWHRPLNDNAPIDESMPLKGLVGTVAHHVAGSRYSQRVVTLREVV